MSSQLKIRDIISASLQAKQELLKNETLLRSIEQSVDLIVHCFSNNGRLWLCGNGGSAADAQHIAAEFSGRFYKDRPALPAEALHTNTSYITSVGNDYSFDVIYSRMIEGVAREGDILIAISTSGNSANIVNAAKAAKEKKVSCISLTGEGGGELKALSNILLNAPSTITPRIQECHILIGHIICELVEEKLYHA